MTASPDEFEFNNERNEIPVKRVGIMLNKIDNLPEDIQAESVGELSEVNKISVEAMSESEIAQYLQNIIGNYPASISAKDLVEHSMFQAILARAREILNQYN